MRAAVVAVVAAALLPLSQTVSAETAVAQPAHAQPHPRSFTGYAFDTCDTPSQRTMNRWLRTSKYWGAGIYVAGMNRACTTQSNLTRHWVRTQTAKGWRLLPLVVGRQAACAPHGYYKHRRISADPSHGFRQARRQGHASANGAVEAARRLGIPRHSALWFDLENFDVTRDRCRRSAMAFMSAWTRQLHARTYLSGLYSSASSGIRMVDAARASTGDGWATPDYLWIAEWNASDSLRSSYISKKRWWPNRRVHQYHGAHTEHHGGATLNIDSNYLSVGRGSTAGTPHQHCNVRIDFRSYGARERGDHGDRVRAAQCLLHQQGVYDGRLHGRYSKRTRKAVRRFQHQHGHLHESGVLTRGTWTALLSEGRRPLLKVGSGSDAVRRLQRALNASSDAGLRIDGVFGKRDLAMVRAFQKKAHLPRTGVVTGRTWRPLVRGRVVGSLPRPKAHVRALLDPFWLEIPFSSGVRHERSREVS